MKAQAQICQVSRIYTPPVQNQPRPRPFFCPSPSHTRQTYYIVPTSVHSPWHIWIFNRPYYFIHMWTFWKLIMNAGTGLFNRIQYSKRRTETIIIINYRLSSRVSFVSSTLYYFKYLLCVWKLRFFRNNY